MMKRIEFLTKPSPTAEPPTRQDIRRNDLLLLAFVVFCLILGWGIRGRALDHSQRVDLGEGLPTVAIPANWLTSSSEQTLFQARNPGSPSGFKAEIDATAMPIREGDTLDSTRTAVSFQRSQELDRYRELTAEPVAVLGGEPAVLVTYAFIADPTRDSGASGLPVVVEAQDLLFRAGNQWLVLSVLADANHFDAEMKNFQLVFDSLEMERSDE